jgi:hypothetical protein
MRQITDWIAKDLIMNHLFQLYSSCSIAPIVAADIDIPGGIAINQE